MNGLRDSPSSRLTRHFFNGLFDFGIWTEEGTDSFKRMLMGVIAALLACGLLLVRVYVAKYVILLSAATPEPYRLAQLADHAMLIALPMWLVALVTVMVSHALFPDETDFRILMAMPIQPRAIFGSKLLALALFAGIFVVASHLALVPMTLLVTVSGLTDPAWPLTFASFLAASLAASGFSALGVVAVQGALIALAPRTRTMAVSSAARSAMICGLVLSFPFLVRLPACGRPLSEGAAWIMFSPPLWFVGLERTLLGDGRAQFLTLALLAIFAFVVAAIISAACYAVLYRHFDRVMVRPGGSIAEGWTRARARAPTTDLRRPVLSGVRQFVMITLRRSTLHQGIVVGLSALGVGLAVNAFLASGLPAVVWASFVVIFAAALAVRTAISIPLELRANWLFRVAEQDAARGDALRAASTAVGRLGVLTPVVALAPIHLATFGPHAVSSILLTLLWGWLYVEVLLRDWIRIPFTCSYLPGKRFVPQLLLIGFLSFVVFTTTGSVAVWAARGFPIRGLIIGAAVGAIAWSLRRRRLNGWRDMPIEFEDQLPTEIGGLKLL